MQDKEYFSLSQGRKLKVFNATLVFFQPLDVLKKLKDSLTSEKLATAESGKAFIEMLRTFRNAGKITIEEVLTNRDSYNIVYV